MERNYKMWKINGMYEYDHSQTVSLIQCLKQYAVKYETLWQT